MTSHDLVIYFFEFYVKNEIDLCVYHIGFSLHSSFLVILPTGRYIRLSLERLDPKS